MAYTIWRKPYGSEEWVFDGMQIDSEKLADQTFSMYHLAPGRDHSTARSGRLRD